MSNSIVPRSNDDIGQLDASNDKFLDECFVDTGVKSELCDLGNAKFVVLGRTGSGKTAILRQIEAECEKSISLDPDSLAFDYISSSTTLSYFESNGVSLAPVYKFLWVHAICIEILRVRYGISNTRNRASSIESFRRLFSSKYSGALDYVRRWEGEFFCSTEERVKKAVDSISENLKAKGKVTAKPVEASGEYSTTTGQKVEKEFLHNGQMIVSKELAKDIRIAMDLIAESCGSYGHQIIVCIDGLDTHWVDSSIKFHLIYELIVAANEIRNKCGVKVLLSLRRDLLESVFYEVSQTKTVQREKFDDFFLELKWSKSDLRDLVLKRFGKMFKDRYSSSKILGEDDFFGKRKNVSVLNYVIERTVLRLRDAISYCNAIIGFMYRESRGFPITYSVASQSESVYSKGRVKSLVDEWAEYYPELDKLLKAFVAGRREKFTFSDITNDEKGAIINQIGEIYEGRDARGYKVLKDKVNTDYAVYDNLNSPLFAAVYILYKCGSVGLNVKGTTKGYSWSDSGDDLSLDKIDVDTKIKVHPMYHSAFNVMPAR